MLPAGTETLTGRAHRAVLLPLAAAEVLGTRPSWLSDTLFRGEPSDVRSNATRDDVFDLIATGGYPGALLRSTTRQRSRWFADYLETVADRDLPSLVDIRNPGVLRCLYRLVAERTATTATMASLAERLDIKPQTARSYVDLLIRAYLLHELPSWTVGVSARVGRRSKFHVTDTGLAAAALGVDATRLGGIPTGGAFLESSVVAEVMKQAAMGDVAVTLAHFRSRTGVEVDLIIERPDGR